MDKPPLYAPWRMDYIRSLSKGETPACDCFLCDAAGCADPVGRARRLVLWTTELSVVLINRFPYTNGHLLIAPRAHKPDLEALGADELHDLSAQTLKAVKLLKRAISPQGFNIGINLGHCSGAGLPGHLHQHVVPRWAGDTNFMGVVADVRVVPQAMGQLHEELCRQMQNDEYRTWGRTDHV